MDPLVQFVVLKTWIEQCRGKEFPNDMENDLRRTLRAYATQAYLPPMFRTMELFELAPFIDRSRVTYVPVVALAWTQPTIKH